MRSDEFDVETTEEDGVLIVTVQQEQEFQGFDGERVSAPVKVAEIKIPADTDLANSIGHALLDWHADQQPTGPPGQKPMHQQYAEIEPDR